MANLANLNLVPSGRELQIRALLEDVVNYHQGVYPHNKLALAVWFHKSAESNDQYLLELFGGVGMGPYLGPPGGIAETRFSLLWQSGSNSPPFVSLSATSVDHFTKLVGEQPQTVAQFLEKFEVLFFDKDLLSPEVIGVFQIVTEPLGLVKGWYIPETEYEKLKTPGAMLSTWGHTRPQVGLVKTWESQDFEYSRAILNVEVGQKWRPVSQDAVKPYLYYSDKQAGRRVYFLLEGGALYEIVKFEVRHDPSFATRWKLLGKTPDDRYPEVYLRAVHPAAEPSA